MPISNGEVVSLVCDLAREDGLRVTVKESIKGGLLAGGCAGVGGLFAGPVGLAFGGIIGSCVAAYCAQGKFQSAASILAAMPRNRKDELAFKVRSIINNVNATDVISLAFLVAGNTSLRQEIMAIVIGYIRDQLQMQICD